MAEENAEVREGASVEEIFESYGRRFPRFAEFRASLAASVNQEYSPWQARLSPGDEVAFLPPVSGGEISAPVQDIFEIVRWPIDVRAIAEKLKSPEDGALVMFDGFVRNHFRGQRTLYLEYEAYEPMALAKMREICAQMHLQFPIQAAAMVHRLGRLEIGETSILIAVSAAHRAAAFEACRYAIDTLKRSVPIWKKEYFEGGAVWAEGETATPPATDTIAHSSENASAAKAAEVAVPKKAFSAQDESTS